MSKPIFMFVLLWGCTSRWDYRYRLMAHHGGNKGWEVHHLYEKRDECQADFERYQREIPVWEWRCVP